jgi:DNA-binding transcriptional LysR family regulator
MSLSLRQLRALVAVADAGSFTDAATDLGVSQATVSRSVAGLESALGVALIRRSTHHLETTAAGSRVIEGARSVLAGVTEIERLAAADRQELHVGFSWSALGRHTAAVQRRWADEHDGARLVFLQSNTPAAGLDTGAVDVAVVRRPVDAGAFHSVLVGTEQRRAVIARDDPLARRRRLRLADFDGATVLVDPRTGTTTADLWRDAGVTVTLRAVDGVDNWLTFIAGGGAVGISPEATVAQYRRPGLVHRPVIDAAPVEVLVAWRRGRPRPDAFIALAQEAYGATPLPDQR